MKNLLKLLLKCFNLELKQISSKTKIDDPVHVLSQILNPLHVNTIIDGGASIGTFSGHLRKVFPYSKVHAFEPFAPHFRILNEISKQDTNIIPIQKAISSNNERKTFYLNESSGTNSFYKSNSSGISTYGDQLKQIGKTEVECITLDHYFDLEKINNIDLLKLDLQGGELDALKGAVNSLKNEKIKFILCELMFESHYHGQPSAGEALHLLMKEYGFSLFNFYQFNYHLGRLIFCDALLFHNSIQNEVIEGSNKNFLPYSNFLK